MSALLHRLVNVTRANERLSSVRSILDRAYPDLVPLSEGGSLHLKNLYQELSWLETQGQAAFDKVSSEVLAELKIA